MIIFFNKMKNELITVARKKILKIFHIRDYRHNLYLSRGKRNKINCWKLRGEDTCPNVGLLVAFPTSNTPTHANVISTLI